MPSYLHQIAQPIIVAEAYILYQDKVLMHQRSLDKKKFPGFWVGPGGHVDEGEDALAAAMREVKEEAGVDITSDQIKLKAVALHHHLDRGEVYVVFMFLATIPDDQPVSQQTHEGHSEWIEREKLLTLENIFPPAKYYFDHVLNDKPGILYNNSQWRDSQLVKVLSQTLDRNL